jgi:hypothetical protein
MLLEWGWSMYFTNPGQKKIGEAAINNPVLEPSYHNIATDDFFFNNASSYTNIYAQIETDRKNSNGNYDAVLGVVKNYSWNLERDGSYNITLSLVSVGSVIDSIKSNVSHNTNSAIATPTENQTAIEYNKDKSTLNKILYWLTTNFSDSNLNDVVKNGSFTEAAKIGAGIGLTPSQNNNNSSSTIDLARFPFNKLSGTEDGQSYKGEYYMKLGCLLRTIQNFILYYSKDNKNQALINFDFDPENNFMFTIPRQISLDPRVCLIQPSPKAFETTAGSTTTTFDRQKKGFYAIPITYSWQAIEFDDDKNKFDIGEKLIEKEGKYREIDNYYSVDALGLVFGLDAPDFEKDTANNKAAAESFLASNIKPNVVTKTTGEKIILGDDKIPEILKQNAGSSFETLLDVYSNKTTDTDEFYRLLNPIYNGGFSTFKKQYELQSGDVGKIFLVTRPTKTTVEKTFASDEGNGFFEDGIHNITIKISTYSVQYWEIKNTVDDFLTAGLEDEDNNDPNYDVNVYARIKNSDFRINKYDFIGKSMNILVNTNYIAQTLEKYVDISTGNISLYDFLDRLMVGIQNALGNINNFSIAYDENKNSFKIIDRTFIPGMNQYKPDLFKSSPVKFITHTLDTSNGSFVREASVKTKLSNNFATQVSVGAQANGNVVGENATALSKWNKGLIDRINKDKEATGGTTGNDVESDYLSNFSIWSDLYSEINRGVVGTKQVERAKNPCIDLFKYEVGALTNQDIIPGVGFLPIDLELTMDGLSGMKLFESYTADDRLLPANYRDKIQFIITGISHKIANNDWTTTVTSISGPKWDGFITKSAPKIKVLKPNLKSNSVTFPVASIVARPIDQMGPEAKKTIEKKDGLVLVRETTSEKGTPGALYYQGKLIAYTLEDPVRDSMERNKKGEGTGNTAIPDTEKRLSGVPYNLVFSDYTGNDFIKGTWQPFLGLNQPPANWPTNKTKIVGIRVGTSENAVSLVDPKGDLDFGGIWIHHGSAKKDSTGCILVSSARTGPYSVKYEVGADTVKAVNRLIYDNKITKLYIVNDLTASTSSDKIIYTASKETIAKAVLYAKRYMNDLGLKDFQAAALLGNFMAEGFPYPDRLQGPGIQRGTLKDAIKNGYGTRGYGWAQWTFPSRQRGLGSFAISNGVNWETTPLTDEINYNFVIKELKNSKDLENLKATTSIERAVLVVLFEYEKPEEKGQETQKKRTDFSRQVLNAM